MTINPGRREFLASMAAVSLFPLEEEKPELILHNANIVSMQGGYTPHCMALQEDAD